MALPLAGCIAQPASLDPAGLGDLPPALTVADPVRVLGALAREPAIAELPDGTLFVAGYGRSQAPESFVRPRLWRSGDGGATWAPVAQGGALEGALGNSDADLAVAPDGTLYHVVLLYFPWGHAVSVGASPDAGATWTWSLLAHGPWVDRPWVEVAPDGTAHAVWSSPRGTHHASSADGGATWTEGPLVHPRGGSGVLAVAPGGALAARIFPLRGPTFLVATGFLAQVDPEADGVAVSEDAGATWTFRALPGERRWPDRLFQGGDVPRWSDPVAFDAAGTLYAAWSEGERIVLGRSADLGATWDTADLVVAQDRLAFYPFLRGGAAGELAASWFTARDDGADLRAHVARVADAATGAPRVVAASLEPETGGDTAGEYFQVLLKDDAVLAALPLQGDGDDASGFAFLAAR